MNIIRKYKLKELGIILKDDDMKHIIFIDECFKNLEKVKKFDKSYDFYFFNNEYIFSYNNILKICYVDYYFWNKIQDITTEKKDIKMLNHIKCVLEYFAKIKIVCIAKEEKSYSNFIATRYNDYCLCNKSYKGDFV